ncbi:MAG: DUF4157 domain-containing protein [Chitinophagaceae bacterium]
MKESPAKLESENVTSRSPFFQKEGKASFFGSNQDSFFKSSSIQAKTAGSHGRDKYEQEADSTADQVVQRLAVPQYTIHQPIQHPSISPLIQEKCAACEEDKKKETDKKNLQKKPAFESEAEFPDEENETVQSKSESGSPSSSIASIESSLNSNKGTGKPLPGDTRAAMESSFGTDFSGVSIHNDATAVQMNKDLHAQAFAHGNDIYFNSGKYDTSSKDGNRLLAHELTHVVQQGGGDKTISRQTDTELHDTAAEVPVSGKKILYKEYVEKYTTKITGELGFRLSLNSYEIPVPHVSWLDVSSRKFIIDLWSPIWTASKNIFNILTEILAPDLLSHPIDYGRDAFVSEGTEEWRSGVITELDRFMSRRLILALRRIIPSYVQIMNKKQLQNEQDKVSNPVEPTDQELRPIHPIDKYILPALKGKLSINYAEYRKIFAEGNPLLPKPPTQRPVELEFQTNNLAPNWIKVINPPDATKEEVAKELYGADLKSWTLSGNTPYYAVPIHRENDPFYSFQPKYEVVYQKNKALTPAWSPGDPLPDYWSGGFIRDEIALNQAKTIKPSKASRSEILQRIWLTKMILDNTILTFQMDDALRPKVDWLEQVKTTILYRYEKLSKATDEEVKLWDAQSLGQYYLISSANEGVLMAAKQRIAFKDFEKAHVYVSDLGFNYSAVISNSDYYVTGKEKLDWANDQSLLFPVWIMEDILKDIRGSVERAKTDKTGNSDPKMREDIYETKKLDEKERVIREKIVLLRNLLLQNPEKAKGLLSEIYAMLQDLQVGATIVSDMDTIDGVWKQIHESISFSGAIRSVWGGGNAILLEAGEANRKLWLEWTVIYNEWRFGDKEKAKKDLMEKANSDEWKKYFKQVASVLEDHHLIDKWMNLGLMVGIAILTGGLGAYVEGFAGAAWGVAGLTGRAALTSWRVWAASGIAITTEAAVFTTLSTAVLEKDPSLSGFLNAFGENLLLFGGLKGISKTYGAILGVEKAATVAGKAGNLATQFAAVNGHALWKANKEKNERSGKSLTWEEIMDISFMNLAFLVAVSIGGKLAESPIQKLVVRSRLQGAMSAVKRSELRFLETSKQVEAAEGKNEKLNKELVKRNNDYLKAQENLMMDLVRIALNPKLAKAAGMSEETANDIRSGFEAVQMAIVVAHLEPIGTNEFLCNSDTYNRAKDAYSGQKDTRVIEIPADKVRNARTLMVITPEKTIRITERFSESKENIVQEPRQVTEPVPETEVAPVPEKSFEQRLEELLTLNSEANKPPRLDLSIGLLRKLNVSDSTILAIIRNGFIHGDRTPTTFFSDVYMLASYRSKIGSRAFNLIIEGLAGDKNFFAARFMMERASWSQIDQVRNILSVFTLEQTVDLRFRFTSGTDAEFANNLNMLATSIEGTPKEILDLLDSAGENQAALDGLIDALHRLGKGKFTPAQIKESLSFDKKLQEAVANKAGTDEIASILFEDKFTKDGDTYKVSAQLSKTKPGDLASAFIRASRTRIARIMLNGGDKGTTINDINWGVIRNIIERTDLPDVVKNDIIGELWAYAKVRQYENMGFTVIREVSIRWKNADGSWSRRSAKVDAVLRLADMVLYKEFKSSATADTSGNQDIVYDLLNRGEAGKLQPFGERAIEAFGGKNMPDFRAGKVDIERPIDK